MKYHLKNGGHDQDHGGDGPVNGAGAHDHCGAGHSTTLANGHEQADVPPQLTRENHERIS